MSNLGINKVPKNILCIGACENVTNKDGYRIVIETPFRNLFGHSAFDAVAGITAKGPIPYRIKPMTSHSSAIEEGSPDQTGCGPTWWRPGQTLSPHSP